MKNNIEHTVFFPHQPKDVWEFLTKPELIEQWLMKNDFAPVVGQQFCFWTKPLPQFDFDGTAYCTVLEVMPFKKLSYTWKGGPAPGKITLDSVVEWTLHQKDNGTELQLVHSGFKTVENFNIFTAMNDGWFRNMNKIGELLNKIINDTASA